MRRQLSRYRKTAQAGAAWQFACCGVTGGVVGRDYHPTVPEVVVPHCRDGWTGDVGNPGRISV